MLVEVDLSEADVSHCEGGLSALVDQIAAAPHGTETPLDLNLTSRSSVEAGDVARLAAACPRLRKLNVHGCDLTYLPEELGTTCRKLEELYAGRNNRLASLPASLCTLTELRVLSLRSCTGLTALPPAIAQLAQLDGALDNTNGKCHYLDLSGCTTLVSPPYSVVEHTMEQTARRRQRMREGGRVQLATKAARKRAPTLSGNNSTHTFAAVRDWFAQQQQQSDDTEGGGGMASPPRSQDVVPEPVREYKREEKVGGWRF